MSPSKARGYEVEGTPITIDIVLFKSPATRYVARLGHQGGKDISEGSHIF